MKIVYSSIQSRTLLTYFEMTEHNGIYKQSNTEEYLYVVQGSFVFRWDQTKNMLEGWNTERCPDWLSANARIFERLPNDFKFNLTFHQSQ